MDCKFCSIIERDEKLKNKQSYMTDIPIYDTKIYETDDFLVVPVLGSIIEGYIMIITKKHIYSMAELESKKMKELNSLIEFLGDICQKIYGICPTVFEHGSASPETKMVSQSSVYHAHMHIVPFEFCNINEIVKESGMKKIEGINAIHEYRKMSYVYCRDHNKLNYITINENLPSQYMRRKLATEIGKNNEWNWREYPFIEHVHSTINAYMRELKKILL